MNKNPAFIIIEIIILMIAILSSKTSITKHILQNNEQKEILQLANIIRFWQIEAINHKEIFLLCPQDHILVIKKNNEAIQSIKFNNKIIWQGFNNNKCSTANYELKYNANGSFLINDKSITINRVGNIKIN